MARRYVRDNRGRFASVGATARGGRLATASGKKRETQTERIAGGKPSGTIGKNRTAKPAAKPAAPAAKTNKAGLTKAEYEAAAAKAWGRAPGGTAKPKASANEQLDRLATRSGNLVRSRSGLTAAEARQASDLGKATGRRVEVSQAANGGYSVRVGAAPKPAPAAARRKPVGKIDDAKASRIVSRIDSNRPGQRRASASTRRDMNSLRTHERATQFLLAPSARMRKRGAPISVNESVKRAVANASKKRK